MDTLDMSQVIQPELLGFFSTQATPQGRYEMDRKLHACIVCV